MTEGPARRNKPLVLIVDDVPMMLLLMREALEQAGFDGNAVKIWVVDQGVGIPSEALPNLFGKFFRVDNRDTRSIGGTGLGLALVREIIKAHGGRIWVESAINVGSTFFFTLPIADLFASEQPPPSPTLSQELTFQAATKANPATDRVLL